MAVLTCGVCRMSSFPQWFDEMQPFMEAHIVHCIASSIAGLSSTITVFPQGPNHEWEVVWRRHPETRLQALPTWASFRRSSVQRCYVAAVERVDSHRTHALYSRLVHHAVEVSRVWRG